MKMNEKRNIIEAALFMSEKPLTLDYLGKVAGVNSLGVVRETVEKLQKYYDKGGLEITKTPQGWTMQVKQELLEKVAHLTPYHDLSEGCKRTLALVAYMEPVKQSGIIRIQGNKAYSYTKSLTRKDLIRAEKQGHTKILKLTPEFERYFGDERESIKEQLKGLIKKPREPEKKVEEKVEEEVKGIEDRLEEIDDMFEVPEELKPKTEEEKKQEKEKKKPKKSKSKRIVKDRPEKDVKASHSHAFEELE